MKSLDKYILEASRSIRSTRSSKSVNVKSSKDGSIIDWVYKFIPHIEIEPDTVEIKNGVANITNPTNTSTGRMDYHIGIKKNQMLTGMPPINLLPSNASVGDTGANAYYKALNYDCNIQEFGFPLNIDDFNIINIELTPSLSRPGILKQICKMVNDQESINTLRFTIYKDSKHNITKFDYKCLKEIDRDMKEIEIPGDFAGNIEFNENIEIQFLSITKYNLKTLPKIITLPQFNKISFDQDFSYNEIMKMLSNYKPNKKIKDFRLDNRWLDRSEEEDIKKKILGK